MMSIRNRCASALAISLAAVWNLGSGLATLHGQTPALPQAWADTVAWRSIGPATMGGRITAIAVNKKDSSNWWAATASGGLLKTVNNGNDFEHQFDREATVSIGDVQVADSDPNILWVGTGEANPRNSVSWGDGVYKSTDGGKTWKNMGLKGSFQIGRIAIHPTNPEIVYVGALGRLWGPNEERGLFRTVDGGANWEKIHYVDDKTGVIDVKLNPGNPDDMIVATYERLRDGFDGNDPVKRYGPGSGLWRSTDGGSTFRRLSEGLPSCNFGRVGFDYYAKDPNFVIAIIETEKIARVPETAPYLGMRGEDADAGSRITEVTEYSPAAKAGLKVNDIVLRADGEPVLGYNQLLTSVRKHVAGESMKLEVSRDREMASFTVELTKFPEGGRPNNPFTGTLGGQAENLQDQQGPDGKEYGGVYLSENGGDSWKRINTLNPRPMYYSHIRFDPQDREKVYVCGTELYRSFDGGKTFKADGVTDGIHVDHHALWVDPSDGRHMILGNDGGIYVTWDTMANWDHHCHVAIGQFYHAGVDSRTDYRVYGGLQDNGSWGGPVRSGRDRGPINSDWFRVGGGDGFITHVDPDDPDQVYSESQNGGMTRLNLRTGERGSMRPRAQRGTQYRFNWMTPFLLSPHNSRIFYAAGNHVFRSLKKGDELVAISPEITNSRGGSGSALSESPVEAGVIYAGTTDGALWVTRNGGQSWEPIFSRPEARTEGGEIQPAANESESGGGEGEAGEANPSAAEGAGERPARRGGRARRGERPAEGTPAETPPAAAGETTPAAEAKPETVPMAETKPAPAVTDAISGGWTFSDSLAAGEQNPLVGSTLRLALNSENGQVTGHLVGRRGEYELKDGKFEKDSGKLSFSAATPIGVVVFEGTVSGEGVFSGNGAVEAGAPPIEFRYQKDPVKAGGESAAGPDGFAFLASPWGSAAALLTVPAGTSAGLQEKTQKAEGTWNGLVESDAIPGGRMEFTIVLRRNRTGAIRGTLESQLGQFEIQDGSFNAGNGKLTFAAGNDEVTIDFEATVDGDTMTGNAMVADDGNEIGFVAKRDPSAESAPAAADAVTPPAEPAGSRTEAAAEAAAASGRTSSEQEEKPAAEKTDGEKQEPAAEKPAGEKQEPAADKPVANALAGKWTGKMTAEQAAEGGRGGRGAGDFTLDLAAGAGGVLAGSFSTERGEGQVTEAKLADDGKVRIVVDNGRFELVFEGKLAGDKMGGTVDFGGNFSMEFEATRGPAEETAPAAEGGAAGENRPAARAAGKKLEELVPGPRWVSSVEASRFRAGRVYLGLDGHRSNDDGIYMFVSEDYGKTWRSIQGNLPASAGSVRILREDIVRENILYVGCEFSAWVSIDRGETWTRFGGLPTVAVHDFAQHPTMGEIVAATHGRSLWVADVTALRQFSVDGMAKPATLYQPAKVIRWQTEPGAGESGTRRFVGQNPANESRIFYSLGENAASAELTITASDGRVVSRFADLPLEKGLHSVVWNLREQGAAGGAGGPGGAGRGAAGGGGGGAGGGGRPGGAGAPGAAGAPGGRAAGAGGGGGGPGGGGRFGRAIRPGEYLVTLKVGTEEQRKVLVIELDPDLPPGVSAESFDESMEWDDEDSGNGDETAEGSDRKELDRQE